MSTAAERVLETIDTKGVPVCDDCISDIAKVFPRQQVNGVARRLTESGVLTREDGRCGVCMQSKIVNQRLSRVQSRDVMAAPAETKQRDSRPPWSSGPGEILAHGIALLAKDTDTNRRLAMISIDNAVELMMKTYLGLPDRITHIGVSKREYEEMSESFPRLLDAIHKHAGDRLSLTEIDLGEVEWYHRLRNQLYHHGNGLTVEKQKVEIYAGLARQLFSVLFGYELPVPAPSPDSVEVPVGPSVARDWFYLSDENVFVVAVNARGSCSVRVFSAENGRALRKKYGAGNYQDSFGTYLQGAKRVHPFYHPNLERECRERLPDNLFDQLKSQIAR